MKTIILLCFSNVFMTFAWYWHLKFDNIKVWKLIFICWSIALIEYCFMVPANRIGYEQFNVTQLKTIQEAISLIVFSIFSVLYLHESMKWNYIVGFILIVLAVFFIFHKW